MRKKGNFDFYEVALERRCGFYKSVYKRNLPNIYLDYAEIKN